MSRARASSNSGWPGSLWSQEQEQVLHALVLLAGVVVGVAHADLEPDRVQDGLLGEGVRRQLERDLVDHHPPVGPGGLQVLELALDDGVVVGDQVVDVTRLGLVLQRHRRLSSTWTGAADLPVASVATRQNRT